MRKIERHKFEAVSLLTVDNGLLDITIIPTMGQPDWVVPSSLIISIDKYYEHIWTYLWRNQEVAIYSLIPRNETPDKIIVLEGNTDVHRVGLLTKGSLRKLQVKISDVKDITLSNDDTEFDSMDGVLINDSGLHSIVEDEASLGSENISLVSTSETAIQGTPLPYVYQTVDINGQTYIVPNLDELSHRLVDLDS